MAAKKETFRVDIKAKSCYEVGDHLVCEVAITNGDNKTYHLLSRETPLEGLRSDIFTVTKDGEHNIPYDGIMLKRGPPRKEYIPIKAKSTFYSLVDLSDAYNFPAGDYAVQLNMNAI